MTKADVRQRAAALALRTAAKPDSQETCFVLASGGREAFLGERIPLRPGRMVDRRGRVVGTVDAVELVTVGQRRGLGGGSVEPRYALAVDRASATVVVGGRDDLLVDRVGLTGVVWVDGPRTGRVLAQVTSHGEARAATFDGTTVRWDVPQRRVAPGQSVALYDGDEVVGGGIALPEPVHPRRRTP
jgi:tRNA-specific 2-thiouridylase